MWAVHSWRITAQTCTHVAQTSSTSVALCPTDRRSRDSLQKRGVGTKLHPPLPANLVFLTFSVIFPLFSVKWFYVEPGSPKRFIFVLTFFFEVLYKWNHTKYAIQRRLSFDIRFGGSCHFRWEPWRKGLSCTQDQIIFCPLEFGFSPVLWKTMWTLNSSCHVMPGQLCSPGWEFHCSNCGHSFFFS